jgi:hypothetical protein
MNGSCARMGRRMDVAVAWVIAGRGRAWAGDWGRKITEYFCGAFDLLCYIHPPLDWIDRSQTPQKRGF